jgi:aminotransferase
MKEKGFIAKKTEGIPPSGIRVIFELAQNYDGMIRLEIGEPDFDTPEHIKKAAEEALRDGYTHYTSSLGMMELREVVAEKLRKLNGIATDPREEVIITSGGSNALSLALMATIDPGEEVLVPDPYWAQYDGLVRVTGGKPVLFPVREENAYQIDPEDVEAKITERTKMLILNSPNNPTGTVLKKDTLEAMADLAIRHNILILSDEAYERIVYDDAIHYSVGSFPGMEDLTISAFTFSKTYAMTGWRLGYARAPKEIVAEMAKLALFQTSCPSSISQKAGIAAMKGPQDCVTKMIEEYKRRRDFIVEGLNEIDGMNCQKPDGAFYVFPNTRSLMESSYELSTFLIKEARVSTTPGKAFGDLGEGHLRVSYANSIENIDKGLKRIKSAVDSLKH